MVRVPVSQDVKDVRVDQVGLDGEGLLVTAGEVDAAALLLGFVHRMISAPEEVVDAAVERLERGPHRHGDRELTIIDVDRLGSDCVGNPLRNPSQATKVGLHRRDDDELIAANASHDVAQLGGPDEALGDGGDHAIASSMTEEIVHGLEAVDVHEEHDERLVEKMTEALGEAGAVQEAGEWVVAGVPAPLLELKMRACRVHEGDEVAVVDELAVVDPANRERGRLGLAAWLAQQGARREPWARRGAEQGEVLLELR